MSSFVEVVVRSTLFKTIGSNELLCSYSSCRSFNLVAATAVRFFWIILSLCLFLFCCKKLRSSIEVKLSSSSSASFSPLALVWFSYSRFSLDSIQFLRRKLPLKV